jgi:hypothetical protein
MIKITSRLKGISEVLETYQSIQELFRDQKELVARDQIEIPCQAPIRMVHDHRLRQPVFKPTGLHYLK